MRRLNSPFGGVPINVRMTPVFVILILVLLLNPWLLNRSYIPDPNGTNKSPFESLIRFCWNNHASLCCFGGTMYSACFDFGSFKLPFLFENSLFIFVNVLQIERDKAERLRCPIINGLNIRKI